MLDSSQKLENLLELAVILGRQSDAKEALRIVSQKTCTLLGAEVASIMMINPKTRDTVKTIIKEGKDIDRRRYSLAQANIVGWCRYHKASFQTDDLKNDDRFTAGLFQDGLVKSAMCVPLIVDEDAIGYLVAMNKGDEAVFDQADFELLEKLAAISAPFLSNVQSAQEYFNTPLPDASLFAKFEAFGLLGNSEPFTELLRAIDAAARCDVRVLLQGQSGAGKELVAKALHKLSARQNKPFVAIDCGAIPEHLIESELFGHVKGAFTGATQDRKGLFEDADRGTLFMDEIANLPMDMQAKLMRVLQEGEVRPVGGNRTRKIDVRIVSASSASLTDLVADQKFREDLYYRLHVYPILIPSLEARSDDIPNLAKRMLAKFAKQQGKEISGFDSEVVRFLVGRKWPGNVRELENMIERLVTLCPPGKTVIDAALLPKDLRDAKQQNQTAELDFSVTRSLEEKVSDYERQLIEHALKKHGWNQSQAARELKTLVQTLRYKMKKLGIAPAPETET